MNRLVSFERLWEGIVNAHPIALAVTIKIHMDFDDSDIIASLNYVKYLKSLQSHHGPVVLSVNTKPKGLRHNIIDSWMPMNTDEYAIFLEDDITVSKHFLQYAEQTVSRYFYGYTLFLIFKVLIFMVESLEYLSTIFDTKKCTKSIGKSIRIIRSTFISSRKAGEQYTALFSIFLLFL
jgi:GR25 family glycosyltransferase involved in LPS biosynthesis